MTNRIFLARMPEHFDSFEILSRQDPISEKLKSLHDALKWRFEFINRVSISIYEPETDDLKAFIDSSDQSDPLSRYQVKLSDVRSLRQIRTSGQPRVVNDLSVFADSQHEHSKRIRSGGYASSYTMPIYFSGRFLGFVFFNSYRKNVF